jgi:hypothetical protein
MIPEINGLYFFGEAIKEEEVGKKIIADKILRKLTFCPSKFSTNKKSTMYRDVKHAERSS